MSTFSDILEEELELYVNKHSDYGDDTIEEMGVVGILVRIHDKIHRALQLSKEGYVAKVVDERLEDTLMDLANYANLGLVLLREGNKKNLDGWLKKEEEVEDE
jgi:hypothetical protein